MALKEYTPPATVEKLMMSDAKMRVIMGPVGSGKSTGCIMEIVRRASMQAPDVEGKRRTRFAVIRNTVPMLRDTTIKTWLDWFPADIAGEWRSTDKTFVLRAGNDIECEIMFRALDDADDVAKLLSLELTGAYINECREIPKEIVEGLSKRVGRFPSVKDRPPALPENEAWPTWHGIWADTNPPEMESWWWAMMEGVDPSDFTQKKENGWFVVKQPSGRSPFAENVENLPDGYYDTTGLSDDYIRVFIDGEYGYTKSGKPVYDKTFKRDFHVASSPLTPIKTLPLLIGMDFGRTPAAILGQLDPRGRVVLYAELTSENMGLERFVREKLEPLLYTKRFSGMKTVICGDPAGVAKQQGNEDSLFMVLKRMGFNAFPAPTNDLDRRIAAVEQYLLQQVDGKAMWLIDPSMTMVIKGFEYGYRFKQIKSASASGASTDYSAIVKDVFSHPHDAVQYFALGVKMNLPARATRAAEPVGRVSLDSTGWT